MFWTVVSFFLEIQISSHSYYSWLHCQFVFLLITGTDFAKS